METLPQLPKKTDRVSTSVAAQLLGLSVQTIHWYKRLGRLNPACRSSSAKQAPLLFNREDVLNLRCK